MSQFVSVKKQVKPRHQKKSKNSKNSPISNGTNSSSSSSSFGDAVFKQRNADKSGDDFNRVRKNFLNHVEADKQLAIDLQTAAQRANTAMVRMKERQLAKGYVYGAYSSGQY